MSITSKVDICNMALGHMGNKDTVSDIDQPVNNKEIVFKLWYDIARQTTLKLAMPNFALRRRLLAEITNETVAFGYDHIYEYPADCLKVLGIGNVAERENNYSVEGNRILTNEVYDDGMPIRFIADVTDVSKFSAEFKLLFSWCLARLTVMPITQDARKQAELEAKLPKELSSASALNAQENRPIRLSHSRFLNARMYDVSRNPTKK